MPAFKRHKDVISVKNGFNSSSMDLLILAYIPSLMTVDKSNVGLAFGKSL